ncbi:MAG: type II CRISPR RNA-guided endonuclease Cas9 [Lachnospiraceae bacterium]|nr:type II CRISPR RNA-guided endonuclease Cas9 [Lachnospiraceae bacterium]
MRSEEYFLGFDMGTGSVGWAVTDTQYHLLKINRKNAWGSVLFETSEGAEERRNNRCARRRYQREKERLELLRELFEEQIQRKDAGFFLRLQESRYVNEDKRDAQGKNPELPYAIFADKDYTDVDYHKEYPTIYHLREALMEQDKEFDVRLVYLAIAHILKNRGHFLANVGSDEKTKDLDETIKELLDTWNQIMLEDKEKFFLSREQKDEITDILKNAKLTKSKKQQEIVHIFGTTNKELKKLISLFTGGKVKFVDLFGVKEFNDLEENDICFDTIDFESKASTLYGNLEEYFEIIQRAKEVYDQMILANILKGDSSGWISKAKVKNYEKHKSDLRLLKHMIVFECMGTPKESKDLYRLMFRDVKANNYSAYVGNTAYQGKKHAVEKKCSRKDFYEFIRKNVLPHIQEGEHKQYVVEQMDLDEFLPKLRVKENSVIPYQLHERELRKILENAERYLPFLQEKDESGKSVSEKILMLLTFRVPYYIGPLNGTHKNAWVKRLQSGRVTPWNFEQMVDIDGSAEEFITRMTSKCTYLTKENVLPKSSLLYEKYMVLNEINNLKIKSVPISVELKQEIYHELFEKKLKVTKKKLIDYLKREKGMADLTREDIGGIDLEFKTSLKSYHAFKQIFTGCNIPEIIKEDIVKDLTLFGAEEALLKKRLCAKYPEYENQFPTLIKTLKCTEWGRLSEKLLNGLAVDVPGLGKVGTVIYQMWESNNNLMQILTRQDSPFLKLIQQENGIEKKNKIDYSIVEELYVSPATKRQIWKALQVLEEIIHVMGHAPKRIFVEMAREPGVSKRSVTRKDELTELYKKIGDEKELLEQLQGEENNRLKNDKLYLYYKQLGICAYTGKAIKIEDFANYDIDHIYPQSKTADDSLDNRVLVYKPVNEDKDDIYPISSSIQEKMRSIWFMWKQKGLISEEKYKRLTRTEPLTNEELTGFINRQLVETRQSTKEFTKLLKQLLPEETEIVYSKAKNVSDFRRQFKIIKVRELNDLHHAKDAYLNIVVGNVYHLRFTKDIRKYFLQRGTYRTYNLTRMFDYDVQCGKETAWIAGEKGSIGLVKSTLSSDKVLVTKQLHEGKGELFDVQPKKKGSGQVPLKSGKGKERLSDIEKYGGYNKAKIAYFSLVAGKNRKGKIVTTFVPIPIHVKQRIEEDTNLALTYIEEICSLSNIEIIIPKVLINTLLVHEGFKMRITGRSESQLILDNANELILTNSEQKLLKNIIKFCNDKKAKQDIKISEKSLITEKELLHLYDIFREKLEGSVYNVMFHNFVEKLTMGREKFIGLSLEDKTMQIAEILKLFQCNAEMPNLLLIGGSKTQGRIRIGMNITDRKNLSIIHQSVTGLFETIERITE